MWQRVFTPQIPRDGDLDLAALSGTEAGQQLQGVLDRANATHRLQTIVRLVEEPTGRRYEEVARVRPDESLADVQQRVEEATARYRIIDSRPRWASASGAGSVTRREP